MIAKTEAEQKVLREGGRKLARILQELKQAVSPGVTSFELEEKARALIKEAGAEAAFLHYQPEGNGSPFPAALCVSINDVIVHGIPNRENHTIQEGDIVMLDTGIRFDGFITDAAITTIAGKPLSKREEELVKATEEALEAAIKKVKAGVRVGDISAAIEGVARKHNLGIPIELGGHGVGRTVHENPFIPNIGSPGAGPELQEGEVIAIEPIFTLGGADIVVDEDGYTTRTSDGSRAAETEHTVMVLKNGCEVLTKV